MEPEQTIDEFLEEILARHDGCIDCRAGLDHNGPRFLSVGEALVAADGATKRALVAVDAEDEDWREVARAALPAMQDFRLAVEALAESLVKSAEEPPKIRSWWRRIWG